MSRKKYYRKENREQFFKETVQAYGEICQICGKSTRYLVIDHDHATGLMRGVLCMGCNSGLGMFKESPERLREAATYLETKTLPAESRRTEPKLKPTKEDITAILLDPNFISDRARGREMIKRYGMTMFSIQARLSRERKRMRRLDITK